MRDHRRDLGITQEVAGPARTGDGVELRALAGELRLERLGMAPKEVAQVGAVLGREFAYELIKLVALRDGRELQAALSQLSEAGLLFCRGTTPHASYLFKHALVQDAAYSTLLRGRRQELHVRVAVALEEHFADLVERQPELLAHHLTAAGAPNAPSING
jgi:predicted ATPase